MSRKTPKLDGGVVESFSNISLSEKEVADISAACGLPVDHVRNRLGQALSHYLIHAVARETATSIAAAEKHLDSLLAKAAALHELNALVDADAPEWHLRNEMRRELDWPDKVATRLDGALGDYMSAVRRVREKVTEKRIFQGDPPFQLGQEVTESCSLQVDPPRQLARELEIIWTKCLQQSLTISHSGQGSAFVRFVRAVTEVLTSHWPWRPPGHREIQSLEAFAKSVGRELRAKPPRRELDT